MQNSATRQTTFLFLPRETWVYKSCDKNGHKVKLENLSNDLELIPEKYDVLTKKVKLASRRHIPRGYRTQDIPGLSGELSSLIRPLDDDRSPASYKISYAINPFSREIRVTFCSWQYQNPTKLNEVTWLKK